MSSIIQRVLSGSNLSSPSSKQQGSDATGRDGNDNNNNKGMKVNVYPEAWAKNEQANKKEGSTNGDDGGDVLQLIGSIDQGTSSTRFMAFTSDKGQVAASAQIEHEQYYPSTDPSTGQRVTGWHEHDPLELWRNTQLTMIAVANILQKEINTNANGPYSAFVFKSIGITNQRETVVAFNKQTGKPYYNAIVWDDTRTQDIANDLAIKEKRELIKKEREKDGTDESDTTQQCTIQQKTGLTISSYFAGTKVKWLLDNVEELRRDLATFEKKDVVCFGTIDTWLLYQLTGGATSTSGSGDNESSIFCTDVTNASRWMFMDLRSIQWDQDLINKIVGPHSLSIANLPKICPSSHVYGKINGEILMKVDTDGGGTSSTAAKDVYHNVPLGAVLGDQQAALFGQTCFDVGQSKNTYGTGLFLMMNTGTKPITSRNGLLTTIAYSIGDNHNGQTIYYALEGSVSHSGSTIQWLRDQLQMIKSASETEELAMSVATQSSSNENDGGTSSDNNNKMYFVPAFSGLFAPYWRSDARACIVGMTMSHTRAHVIKAALEACAYQTRDVFDSIIADTDTSSRKSLIGTTIGSTSGGGTGNAAVQLKELKVDGGGTANGFLMQYQADMLGVPVIKPQIMDTTALGAAYAAGLSVGVYQNLDEIRDLYRVDKVYQPTMSETERQINWNGWKKAIDRSLGWITTTSSSSNGDGHDDVDDDDTLTGFQDALEEEIAGISGNSGGIGWLWTFSLITVVGATAGMIGFRLGKQRK